jgi:hypothetical protein
MVPPRSTNASGEVIYVGEGADATAAGRLILARKLQQAQAQFNKRHIGGTKAEQ